MVVASIPNASQGLPAPLTRLIGREREVEAVSDLVQQRDVRLLTLVGPGGVGKSRLALAVAGKLDDTFPDLVRFVALAPLSDPKAVLPAFAAALSIIEQPHIPLTDVIGAHVGERRALIVLDNFEHLIEAATDVGDLLAMCPNLKVLVTSRTPLHLYGEHEFPVPPLDLPEDSTRVCPDDLATIEAIALFVDRARAVRPDFALTEGNARAIAAICRKLDGLPLALELAAARIRLFSISELLARLDRPLSVLSGGPRNVPARQQTMREAIAWSYSLLTPDQQRLLCQLAVFAGGWTLEAAEAVCDRDLDISEDLGVLVEHSLVHRSEQPDGTPRFSMLEMIREFGLEELTTSSCAQDTLRRHAMHFLPWAVQMGQEALIGDQTRAILLLEPDIDNVRAAFGWVLSHDEPDQPLLDAALCAMGWLFGYWRARGRVTEGRRWLESALAKPGASDMARASALDGAGGLAAEQGDFEQAIRQHEESMAIALDHQDGQRQTIALWGLSRAAAWSGEVERAVVAFEEGIALSRRREDRAALANFLGNYGEMLAWSGEAARARPVFEEAATVYREAYGFESSIILMDLAYVMMLDGHLDRAREMLVSSLGMERVRGPSRLIADCLEDFAYLAVIEQQPERFARLLGAADALRHEVGAPLNPSQRQPYKHFVERGRSQLSEQAWNGAWAEGRTMPLDEAIDYALAIGNDAEQPASPASSLLSKREIEVLRLVIEGRSNKEIAEALFISPRTVAQHLRSIYTKLGVESRTAAATWAVRHGLV